MNDSEQAERRPPAAIVVMGVAGSGKTAVGEQLAKALGVRFIEGDRFHPPRNVALMSAGTPLTDEDRVYWLDAIGTEIARAFACGKSTITACSALKRAYRDRLRGLCPQIQFLYLEVDRQTAAQRVASRRNHFMPPSLVDSQFEALMPPGADEPHLTIDARMPLDDTVAAALSALRHSRLVVPSVSGS